MALTSELLVDKIDMLHDDLHSIARDVAVVCETVKNLNGELQEHKKNEKWRATRNIAIVTIMFTALSCWVGIKGLSKAPSPPTGIVKELHHDKDFSDNRGHGKLD